VFDNTHPASRADPPVRYAVCCAGEVVKSNRDMRIALLRQEFVDELIMERSLKDEFLSVFKEVRCHRLIATVENDRPFANRAVYPPSTTSPYLVRMMCES
jgi:hypothetical protein